MRTLKHLVIAVICVVAFGISAAAQTHSVTLSWTPPVAQTGVTITVYNVYRADTSGGQVAVTHPLDPSGVPGTTFTDTTVLAGKTYYYKVTTFCTSCTTQESVMSNEVKAIIPALVTQPGAPTVTTVVVN